MYLKTKHIVKLLFMFTININNVQIVSIILIEINLQAFSRQFEKLNYFLFVSTCKLQNRTWQSR